MSNNIDALAYSEMPNIITDIQTLDALNNQLGTNYGIEQLKQYLNNTLLDTTIKRACCLKQHAVDNNNNIIPGYYVINVRMPLPSDIKLDQEWPLDKIYKEYNIYDKQVLIPENLCNDYANIDCDNFYQAYCSNSIKDYKNARHISQMSDEGNNSDYTIFSKYWKPECACYMEPPKWLKSIKVIPKCLYPGCNPNKGVYMDPVSRGQECQQVFCKADINFSEVMAGRDNNIINQIELNCGKGAITEEEIHNLPPYHPPDHSSDQHSESIISGPVTEFFQKIFNTINSKFPGNTKYFSSGSSSLLLCLCCFFILALLFL